MSKLPLVSKGVGVLDSFHKKLQSIPVIGQLDKGADILGVDQTVRNTFMTPKAPTDTITPLKPDAVSAPASTDAATQVDAQAAQDEQRRPRGRASTIFAGLDQGSQTGTVSSRTLLGY